VALLHERAEILGIAPAGTISAGGTCRLLRARDGHWVAINLARRSDVDLLAAWMGRDWCGAPWDAVSEHLATVDGEPAVMRAQLLGIPAAVAVPAIPGAAPARLSRGPAASRRGTPVVLDCSALWAGPLCARLLADAGAQVSKVELVGRPDGARAGHPEFWRRLNGDKREVTVERDALPGLLEGADVVVTSARPRAIEQLDLDLARRVHDDGLLWISITGYGFESEWRDRVAFGDDAAVAGGLAVAAGGPDAPVFVGDAPADPLAGMHAARAALHLVHEGSGGFVDVSLRDAVAHTVTSGNYGQGAQPERRRATAAQVPCAAASRPIEEA
jgi:CoA-transferase family III